MRLILSIATTWTALSFVAMAGDLPPDWSALADGTLLHAPSAAKCSLDIAGLKRTTIESKGAPDLGICSYADESGHEGLIRVRQYVRGVGETPLAIQNDEVLIEPKPGMPDVVVGYRVGPGPDKNGAPTRQFVLTTANNGLLIDCIGRQLASDTSDAGAEFGQQCLAVQPSKR